MKTAAPGFNPFAEALNLSAKPQPRPIPAPKKPKPKPNPEATPKWGVDVDWNAVSNEYRLGQLSLTEISRIYQVSVTSITAKARQNGWVRDLAERVQEAVMETVLREDAKGVKVPATEGHDEALVRVAAVRGAEIVQHHRAQLARAEKLVGDLVEELETTSKYARALLKPADGQAAPDANRLLLYAKKVTSLNSRTMSANHLATALKTLINEQRRAYHLDGPQGASTGDDGVDSLMKMIRGSSSTKGSARGRLAQEASSPKPESELWLEGHDADSREPPWEREAGR